MMREKQKKKRGGVFQHGCYATFILLSMPTAMEVMNLLDDVIDAKLVIEPHAASHYWF